MKKTREEELKEEIEKMEKDKTKYEDINNRYAGVTFEYAIRRCELKGIQEERRRILGIVDKFPIEFIMEAETAAEASDIKKTLKQKIKEEE